MSEKKLRIDVIGAGNWTKKAHLPAFANQKTIEVVDITDLDENRAMSLAKEFSISKHYSGLGSLLTEADLDILDVITSRGMHFEPVMTGIERELPQAQALRLPGSATQLSRT